VALYEQVLQHTPPQPEALHLLGLLAHASGDAEGALGYVQQAIAMQPHSWVLHSNVGEIYRSLGRLEEAARSQQRALRLAPTAAAAYSGLGRVRQAQGRYAEARRWYETALRLHPACAVTHYNLGTVCHALGHLEAARLAYSEAVQRDPASAAGHYQLGVLCRQLGRPTLALQHLKIALSLQPDLAEAHHQLGRVLQELGHLQEAVQSYQQAIQYQPDNVEAYTSHAYALQARGRFAEAITSYDQVLARRPDEVGAHFNRGTALYRLGDHQAALASYDRVLALAPDHLPALWSRAHVWLALGELAPGWVAYEWRWRALGWPRRLWPAPRWDGTALAGRKILVHSEQGVGDELLFATCLPEVLAQAAQVIVECDPRLVSLLRRAFPAASVWPRHEPGAPSTSSADLPRSDVQLPIGSLPRYVRPRLQTFPVRSGYLVPEPLRLAHWQSRLDALGPGLRVGLAWRSLASRHTALHYTQLCQWRPVLRLPGIHWVNLQYDDYAAELTAIAQQWGIRIQHWPDLDTFEDLEALAAVMAGLDLVIAPETTIAALAGSLGLPVWRLSIASTDWDVLGTAAMPWYPTMRIYRQAQLGEWAEVFARVAADLQRLVAQQKS
jgi:tetratricopeptide (TPR) repeat protein